jgi:Serine/Threonine/Tyrosine Kinase found in polyvalent proteins
MYDNETRRKLQDIISGKLIKGQTDNCSTARNYLSTSYTASTKVKTDFENRAKIKEEQSKVLKEFAKKFNFLLNKIPTSNKYFAKGGEAKIFLADDGRNVIKLNSGIYYNTWLDFLNSVLIHNLLFKDSFYILVGFIEIDDELFAVLQQSFIISNELTNLENVKNMLEYNGFFNTRRNDYYNKELSLILEDIHDENVITQNNTLFFIDTVFYINSSD